MIESVLKVKDVAARLGVDEKAVLSYIEKGKLRANKPGKEWLITVTAFNAFVNGAGGKRIGAHVVVVANQKGGVGKTTTAINFATALGLEGKRVLLVDLDPQAACARSLGLKTDGVKNTIYSALMEDMPITDVIQHTEHHFDFAASNINLAGAEVELINVFSRETKLRRCLAPIMDTYQYVIVDTHPSLGLLEVNALTAARSVLIPVSCDVLSLGGLEQLFKTVNDIQSSTNADLTVMGILATRYDGRVNISKAVYDELGNVAKRAGVPLLTPIIKEQSKVKEAPAGHLPAVLFAPKAESSLAYIALAQEIIHAEA